NPSSAARYKDYIEDVQKRGLVGALTDIASGYNPIADFAALSSSFNNDIFMQNLNTYSSGLNTSHAKAMEQIRSFLSQKKEIMDALIFEMDYMVARLNKELKSKGQNVTRSNYASSLNRNILDLRNKFSMSSQELSYLSRLQGNYKEFKLMQDNLSWLEKLKAPAIQNMNKQIQMVLLEGLVEFISAINPSFGAQDRNMALSKNNLAISLEGFEDKMAVLSSLLSNSPHVQKKLNNTLGGLREELKLFKDKMQNGPKILATKSSNPLIKERASVILVSSQKEPQKPKEAIKQAPGQAAASTGQNIKLLGKKEKPYVVVDSKEIKGAHRVVDQTTDKREFSETAIKAGDSNRPYTAEQFIITGMNDTTSGYKANLANKTKEYGNATFRATQEVNLTKEIKNVGSRAENITDSMEYTLEQLKRFKTPDSTIYGMDTDGRSNRAWTEEEYRKFLEQVKAIEEASNITQ
ncbi:MAG: hypothetical protein KKE64_00095, partial [Candidatus Omnitrophica bacterium]|nr:hypothetical protein [Candidatus Omnitrophota bacterium]